VAPLWYRLSAYLHQCRFSPGLSSPLVATKLFVHGSHRICARDSHEVCAFSPAISRGRAHARRGYQPGLTDPTSAGRFCGRSAASGRQPDPSDYANALLADERWRRRGSTVEHHDRGVGRDLPSQPSTPAVHPSAQPSLPAVPLSRAAVIHHGAMACQRLKGLSATPSVSPLVRR
jgi:hypothetical protein